MNTNQNNQNQNKLDHPNENIRCDASVCVATSEYAPLNHPKQKSVPAQHSVRFKPRMLSVLAICVLALSWNFLPEFTLSILCYIGLYALVALGLVLLTGVGGMTSFGQAAFVGLGAYATAWVCTSPVIANALGLESTNAFLAWIGLGLGLSVTALIAWLLSSVTLRLSGHYLPLGTIAWGLSLYFLFGNLAFLGGHTGLSGVMPLSFLGWTLATPKTLGILIWSLVILTMWALHNLLDSREGRAIRSLKSTRVMAESMGIDTNRYRLKTFVFAALLAALSGWLYAHFQRFVNPTPFHLHIGIEYLFMVVVGGSGHLWGALLGAFVVTLLKQQLQDWLPLLLGHSGHFEVIAFGLLMLLVLQHFQGGLWAALERFCRRWIAPVPFATARIKGNESNASFLLQSDQTSHQKTKMIATNPLLSKGSVLIRACDITKHFGGLVANNAIHLDLKAGEIHALIGPNGAGKSTFFDMLSGLSVPTSGHIEFMGKNMNHQAARAFALMGLGRSFQHVKLLNERSVLENVAIGAHRQGKKGWISSMLRLDRHEEAALLAQAKEQIARCGLSDFMHFPAGDLALGQQRIVEIARALTSKPCVLLLDEPAAGLRHLEKQALADLLKQLRDEGLGLLIVEHDMEFVMNLADRVSVLEFGSLIAHGQPKEIQNNAKVREAYLGVDDTI